MGSLSFLVVGSIQAFSVERLRDRGGDRKVPLLL